jgi:hypothetical protein
MHCGERWSSPSRGSAHESPKTLLTTSLALAAAPTIKARAAGAKSHGLTCRNFRMNSDGRWGSVRPARIVGPQGLFTVVPGMSCGVRGENNVYGVKIGEPLNSRCRPPRGRFEIAPRGQQRPRGLCFQATARRQIARNPALWSDSTRHQTLARPPKRNYETEL